MHRHPYQHSANHLYVVGLKSDFESIILIGKSQVFIIKRAQSFAGFLLDALDILA